MNKNLHTYCVYTVLISCALIDLLQMWDIRDGMCKQTFTGHESDINAITVRITILMTMIIIIINKYD